MNTPHSSRTHIEKFALMMQIVASALSISFTILMCALLYWQVEAQIRSLLVNLDDPHSLVLAHIIDMVAFKLMAITAVLTAIAFFWRTILSKKLLKDFVQEPFGMLAQRARCMSRGEISEISVSEQLAMRQGMRVMLQVNELDDLFRCIDSMSEYLQELTVKAQSIAEGDLAVHVKPRSEEDLLSIAFENVAARLTMVISQVRERLIELKTAVGDLSSSSHHQSARIESQAAAIQQSMPVLDQLRDTVGLANARAKDMLSLVPQTNEIATTGGGALSIAARASLALQEQIQQIEVEISQISSNVDHIVQVVNFVREAVDQSRLLSVNAAIEAAKADSTASNLQTVALQIGGLSQRSRESAMEIESVMQDIQKTTHAAMKVIQEGSQLCQQAISSLDLVKERASDVMKSVERSNDAGLVIANVMEKQMLGAEEVLSLTQTISGAAGEIVTTSRKQSQAAATLTTLAEQIAHTVDIYKLSD